MRCAMRSRRLRQDEEIDALVVVSADELSPLGLRLEADAGRIPRPGGMRLHDPASTGSMAGEGAVALVLERAGAATRRGARLRQDRRLWTFRGARRIEYGLRRWPKPRGRPSRGGDVGRRARSGRRLRSRPTGLRPRRAKRVGARAGGAVAALPVDRAGLDDRRLQLGVGALRGGRRTLGDEPWPGTGRRRRPCRDTGRSQGLNRPVFHLGSPACWWSVGRTKEAARPSCCRLEATRRPPRGEIVRHLGSQRAADRTELPGVDGPRPAQPETSGGGEFVGGLIETSMDILTDRPTVAKRDGSTRSQNADFRVRQSDAERGGEPRVRRSWGVDRSSRRRQRARRDDRPGRRGTGRAGRGGQSVLPRPRQRSGQRAGLSVAYCSPVAWRRPKRSSPTPIAAQLVSHCFLPALFFWHPPGRRHAGGQGRDHRPDAQPFSGLATQVSASITSKPA